MALVPCLCPCDGLQEKELFSDLQETRRLKGCSNSLQKHTAPYLGESAFAQQRRSKGAVPVSVLRNVWPGWVARSAVFLAIRSGLFLYLLKCHFWQTCAGEILYVEEKEIGGFPLPPPRFIMRSMNSGELGFLYRKNMMNESYF